MDKILRMKRPTEFYQCAWETFNADKRDVFGYQKALDAFAFAANKYDVTLSGCMKNKSQALSHMKDDVYRKVRKAYMNKYEIIESKYVDVFHEDGNWIVDCYVKGTK